MKINLTTTVRPVNAYRMIVRAMREQRPVTVEYTRANGSKTTRTVEPYMITRNKAGDRYVRAMDWQSEESRTFRLDRITAYGLGPAFGFKITPPEGVHLTPEDRAAYNEWADEQQKAFFDHAFDNWQDDVHAVQGV